MRSITRYPTKRRIQPETRLRSVLLTALAFLVATPVSASAAGAGETSRGLSAGTIEGVLAYIVIAGVTIGLLIANGESARERQRRK